MNIAGYLIVIIFGFVCLLIYVTIKISKQKEDEPKSSSPYQKKPFLLDTNSEFHLFKILQDLFGDKYYIFPQINYSHLIEPKTTDWKEARIYRSHIDRKSADFVLCEKEHLVPQLVIELDGVAHTSVKKRERDQFIDTLTEEVDLPILHLKNNELDRESILEKINSKLV